MAISARCRWRWLPLLVGASCLPAAAQEVAAAAAGTTQAASCRPMGSAGIYGLTAIVLLGTFAALSQIDRRLRREGWSLANALSEPTTLKVPADDPRWLDSMGDRQSATEATGFGKGSTSPTTLTVLEASSSRLIALVGMVVILMMYTGFGIFSLFSFGFTCSMPASSGAVTGFLYAGLTLFAPYVANQFSKVLQPLARQSGAVPPAAPPVQDAPLPPSPPRTAPSAPARLQAAPPTSPGPTSPGPSPRSAQPRSAQPRSPHLLSPQSLSPQPLSPKPRSPQARAPQARSRQPSPQPPPAPHAPWEQALNPWQPAIAMIAQFEGFVDHAYPDPATGAEPWTIGYGFTSLAGQPIVPGQTITKDDAERELSSQVETCARHLATTIPDWSGMNDNQRCALIDFAWNLGLNFYGDEADFASITRDLRTHNWAQVPQTLCLYCDPGTAVTDGLLRRRQAEGALWLKSPEPHIAAAVPSTTAGPASAPHAPAATHPNPLKVPYCDQLLMGDGQGYRECFSASSAMLAAYWGKEPSEDAYDRVRRCYGDSTSSEAQLEALRSLGLQADFRTDGTVALLKAEIDAGRPVAAGWLCDGPVNAPSGGGHWIVIIGYDATGFLVNDPYGNCDLVAGGYLSHHDGAGLHYSYRNWVPRWRPQDSGGWMLTCQA